MRVLPALLVIVLLLCPALAHAGDNPNVASAKKALTQALKTKQIKGAENAIGSLHRENSSEAAQVLVKLFPYAQKLGTKWYWTVIKGLAAFTSRDAMTVTAEFIVKYKRGAPGRDCMFWVQSNYSPYGASVLIKIVPKVPKPIQFMIIDHLATLRQKTSVAPLIDLLEKNAKSSSPLKFRIIKALRSITTNDFGTSIDAWRRWWNINRDKALPSKTATAAGSVDLGGGRDYGYGKLTKGEKGKILVITATKPRHNFDNIDSMLRGMNVPHKTVTKKEFNKLQTSLKGVMAIFINCTNFREHCICKTCKPGGTKNNRMYQCQDCNVHVKYQDILTPEAVRKIADWTHKGGYLFTEDLCIIEVLDVGFSKYVKSGKKLGDQTIPVRPTQGMTTHAYLKRVFARMIQVDPPQEGGSVEPPKFEKVEHTWKIDDESPAIQIVNKGSVKTLMESQELADKNQCDKAVAIIIGAGGKVDLAGVTPEEKLRGGRVLHVMSHFTKQKSQRDGYTMKNLLLNYLIEANERYLARKMRNKLKPRNSMK